MTLVGLDIIFGALAYAICGYITYHAGRYAAHYSPRTAVILGVLWLPLVPYWYGRLILDRRRT